MVERIRLFLFPPLLFACFLLGMTGFATAGCLHFKPIRDLTAEMWMVANGQTQPGVVNSIRIARHVDNIELDKVRQQLQEMNLSPHFRHVKQLASTAAEYSRVGRIADQSDLVRNLRRVEEIFEFSCDPGQKNVEHQQKAGDDRANILHAILESESFLVKITLLLFFLFGVIGFLYLANFLAGYTIGLLHEKRICRIPAQLCGDEHVFPGIVTRAGLNGVRFEFENDAIAKRLTDLMANPGFIYFDVQIGKETRPVFVDGYHKFFSPLYFLRRLTRKELSEILTLSTRAVKYAPAIGHKSTRGKWRAEIKQRKANIKNTTRQRASPG